MDDKYERYEEHDVHRNSFQEPHHQQNQNDCESFFQDANHKTYYSHISSPQRENFIF